MSLSTTKILALAIAIAAGAIQSAQAVLVRGSVRIDATDIHVIGGSIIGVGTPSPVIDFSGTDVSALGAGNPWDQGSFMNNDCVAATDTCSLVRIRIGGVMDIDTSPGFGLVAPRVGAERIFDFVLDRDGRLEMGLSIAASTEVDPLSDFPGAGTATYSFGAWEIVGPLNGFLGPTALAASAPFAMDEVIGIDLPAGTYRLIAPAVAVKLCVESPADGFCGVADVAAPAALPLFGVGVAMLGAVRMRRRVVPVHIARD